jgi:hypothetical protein
MNIDEDFRKELDDRANSKGCQRAPGFAYGDMVSQGYSFRGKIFQYIIVGEQLIMRVTPDAPQGALLGAVRHALDPSLSPSEHEAQMVEEIRMTWNDELSRWLLQKNSDGSLLGIDDRLFDHENLAQCCVNWLCN